MDLILGEESRGFLERVSWWKLLGAIITAITGLLLLPEYIFNLRPSIERALGSYVLAFAEGSVCSALIVLLTLKALSQLTERRRATRDDNPEQHSEEEESR